MDFMERGTPGNKAIPQVGSGGTCSRRDHQPLSVPLQSEWGIIASSLAEGTRPATALQSISDFHLRGDAKQIDEIQNALGALYQGEGSVGTRGSTDPPGNA